MVSLRELDAKHMLTSPNTSVISRKEDLTDQVVLPYQIKKFMLDSLRMENQLGKGLFTKKTSSMKQAGVKMMPFLYQ